MFFFSVLFPYFQIKCLISNWQQSLVGRTAEMEAFPTDNVPTNGEIRDDHSSDLISVASLEDSDESDTEENKDESREERTAREEIERQRVLQAAGLIVTADAQPSQRKRRPAPAAPQRSSVTSSILSKDLPPIPDLADTGLRVDDAFDRYEAFRFSHGNVNRMSVASVDTLPSPGSMSMTPSGEGESRGYTGFLHFLGGRSPPAESDRRSMPTISAPMSIAASRAESPAFGTVSVYSVFLLGQLIALGSCSRGPAWWTRRF
jgi:hypothetical protein